MTKPFLYVALDGVDQRSSLAFAQSLIWNESKKPYGFKVKLDMLADFGPRAGNPYSVVQSLRRLGNPVFVDMKMWNGRRTMSSIARGCAKLGVDIVNMYTHAGQPFVESVAETVAGTDTKLFCLTVLTHYTDEDCMRLYGKPLRETVRMFGEDAMQWGADGLILPATTLDVVADLPGERMCPAIRPAWYEDPKANDQEQVVTLDEVIEAGPEYIVMGSPIRKARNPRGALDKVLEKL